MTQKKTQPQAEHTSSEQFATVPTKVQEQAGQSTDLQQGVQPHWPTWPTSKPGSRATPPPPGMRSINPLRSEQMAEIGYNQQTGEPSTQSPLRSLPDETKTGPTSFDQPTAQEVIGKRKKRL